MIEWMANIVPCFIIIREIGWADNFLVPLVVLRSEHLYILPRER